MTETRNDADVAFIRALAELLNENELTEINVKREYGEKDSLNVRVSRMPAPVPGQPVPAPVAAESAPAPAAPRAQRRGDEAGGERGDDPARHPGAVTSPMVGTAYMAAEPGADPFVSIGSQVAEGETLLIIEAMKTMNHIPAPHAGTVKRILVTDGSAVEYGAPLVILE